jgi:hypothetical protein
MKFLSVLFPLLGFIICAEQSSGPYHNFKSGLSILVEDMKGSTFNAIHLSEFKNSLDLLYIEDQKPPPPHLREFVDSKKTPHSINL